MFDSESILRLEFKIGQLNNKSMTITVSNNDLVEILENLDEGIFVYKTQIKFPVRFFLTLSGKGPMDTEVDDQGQVTKDKCVILQDINIDGISCHPNYLYKCINLITDTGQHITTNYWGFNGRVDLNFDFKNSFYWALHCVDHIDCA